MNSVNINLSKASKLAIVLSVTVATMYLASGILIPIAFAMFFALLLYPVCNFFERKLSRIFSILLTFIVVILLISGIIYFFGSQFFKLFQNIRNFGENIQAIIDSLIQLIENTVFHGNIDLNEIVENQSEELLGSGEIIEKTIVTSTGFIASTFLIFVYTFLFLLYRTSFKKFVLYHFKSTKKPKISDMLYNIQKVAQNYFFGLFIIIVILGTLNGIGLLIIGLDYPFLFGYFAALLAIIPYIGTFIGGVLPFLYALINHNNLWMAVFVAVWYIIIQALEGNILTPKIVGSKVSLNPLIALVALLTGGLVWGIAGMILFIPFMAILKVIFDNTDTLKPYGLLLGSNFGDDELHLLKKLGKKIEDTVDKID